MTAFDELTGTYLRLYWNKKREKARLEAVERLGKPLPRAIEEKLAPDLILIKMTKRILELLEDGKVGLRNLRGNRVRLQFSVGK